MSNGTKRINIIVSEKVNDMLDDLSDAYGVSKSSIAAMAIGQYVEAMNKQRAMMYGSNGFMESIKARFMEEMNR